ncbi:MAG: hypothetical protein ACTHN0_05225, partial [Aquihabitans sp.]
MIELDAASFLLQWAVGGLFFTWVTTRRREVGIGYGWTMRITFGLMAAASLLVSRFLDPLPVRDAAAVGVILATSYAFFVSYQRRAAGVAGQREVVERRTARVAAMTGIDKDEERFDKDAAEFPPSLDLIAPAIGVVGLVAAGIDAGSPAWLSVARILIGAAFLGAITDAMLLGHWYLVQPGLARGPLLELVRWTQCIWPFEVLVMLIPASQGMLAVLNGTIDDDYGGILGWMWATCAVTTLGLL